MICGRAVPALDNASLDQQLMLSRHSTASPRAVGQKGTADLAKLLAETSLRVLVESADKILLCETISENNLPLTQPNM